MKEGDLDSGYVTGGVVQPGLGSSTAYGRALRERADELPRPHLPRRHQRRPQQEVELEREVPPLAEGWCRRERNTLICKGCWKWRDEHINLKNAMQVHSQPGPDRPAFARPPRDAVYSVESGPT